MEALNNLENRIKALMVGYLANEIDQDDLRELQQWITSSPENKELFNRIKTSWMVVKHQQELVYFDSQQSFTDLKKKINNPKDDISNEQTKSIRIPAIWKYAAIALLFLAIGSMLSWLIKPADVPYGKVNTVIQAPLGAKSIVVLPDGTNVWLNAGSKIEYGSQYGKANRIISLSGEAFFDVAKDKSVPFLVKTSQLTVKALGTRFNVKAYPEEKTITTTLEEGEIEVETHLKQKGSFQKIHLKPNEKIVYYKPGTKADLQTAKTNKKLKQPLPEKIEVTQNINTTLYTSWKDNRWILKGESLGTLGVLMERRFNVTMIFQEPELKNYKFSGIIENETLEQILSAFRYTAPIDYKINKDTIFINLNNSLKAQYQKLTE